MANEFHGNRFVLDTSSVAPLSQLATSRSLGSLRVTGIRWVGGTTNGHRAILQDSEGKTFWESTWNTATPGAQESRLELIASRDMAITLIESGTLYVYIA